MGNTESKLLTALTERIDAKRLPRTQQRTCEIFLWSVQQLRTLSRWVVLGDVGPGSIVEVAEVLNVDPNELKTHIAEIVREGYAQ